MQEKTEQAPKKAKHLLRDIVSRHYQNAWDAKEKGEKVGWCASNFPQEICETLGVPVVYPENQAAAISAKGAGQKMCEHSESNGYSNDICAYARISLAYMDLKECKEMDMPQPDFVLCCNNICNQMIKWYENIARELDIPMIFIDIPYNTEFETSDDRVKYIRAQFDDAIVQLEEITGKTFSEERFKEVMEISQRSSKAWLGATEYTKYTPSPLNGFDLFNHMAVAVCARGKIETAIAFELLEKEYEQAVKDGTSTYRGEQDYRVLFEGIACWPYLRHKLTTLMKYNINVVGTVYADAFGVIYSNVEEMMKAYSYVPNAVSFERALNMRVKVVNKNNCDGAVIHTNRSCKMWSGFMYELERKLREETDIPTVTFDGDQADPRNFSEAQYDTRIQGLYEVMEANRKGDKL
ncbi:MAG: 2-hydroxyacyl-CoA dehydratase subunit D [Senegalia sp. (in: firmicutes)]